MKWGCAAAEPEFGKVIVPSVAFWANAEAAINPYATVNSSDDLTLAIQRLLLGTQTVPRNVPRRHDCARDHTGSFGAERWLSVRRSNAIVGLCSSRISVLPIRGRRSACFAPTNVIWPHIVRDKLHDPI